MKPRWRRAEKGVRRRREATTGMRRVYLPPAVYWGLWAATVGVFVVWLVLGWPWGVHVGSAAVSARNFATRNKSGQLLTSDPSLARLFTAGPLRAGDAVTLSGSATRETRLTLVVVDHGRTRFVNFDRLGLERGGAATVLVSGERVRLHAPRAVVAPSANYVARGYREVTALRVRARGRRLLVSFRAPGSAANVYELTDEAIKSHEGLYGEGEVVREAILAHREIRTSPGMIASVRLPRRRGAFAIYVKPLSRSAVVRPALALVPQR